MLSLGIDSGSTTTKGILFDGTEIVSALLVPTTARPKESLNTVYKPYPKMVWILPYLPVMEGDFWSRRTRKSRKSPAMPEELPG